MVAFIDANRAEFGVEPIIAVLASAEVMIAPSGYYAARSRPASARQVRDAEVTPRLQALWEANYRAHGARKLWKLPAEPGSTSAATRSPG